MRIRRRWVMSPNQLNGLRSAQRLQGRGGHAAAGFDRDFLVGRVAGVFCADVVLVEVVGHLRGGVEAEAADFFLERGGVVHFVAQRRRVAVVDRGAAAVLDRGGDRGRGLVNSQRLAFAPFAVKVVDVGARRRTWPGTSSSRPRADHAFRRRFQQRCPFVRYSSLRIR